MQKRIFFSFWKVEKSNNPMHKTMCCETKGEAMSMRENEPREKEYLRDVVGAGSRRRLGCAFACDFCFHSAAAFFAFLATLRVK